ncbi:hypothetical protein Cgig2_019512 [Carnegiea gigantea]|uniref:Uncharacterized protein n=1 Tax=Carnegiea gigantea TaxID=171969 RepID=A0A9Q1KQ50_9CARY|nr:hypothetical protein Cgig2_019512 [Carnegiea gigantea]
MFCFDFPSSHPEQPPWQPREGKAEKKGRKKKKDMDEGSSRNEALRARIQQLERERDELHKEIEQLCMQKAGPSYIAVATQMHFRRTAGLEQEIENLKNKLESCVKENSDLKQQLSEAKRITNAEAIKQLELLNGVVATASAERDHAMMEAVKAKEDEDLMSQKLHDAGKRTSGLEQEVENLKKKLESCAQENSDIKKNLSEAKTITNTELAKQLELFNGVFATASAERDHAKMEVENLKKKLEFCTQENSDIKKELSEAKTITKHLDQLHKLEVTKNTEVVKQLELLHGIVATASAERDHAMMEALKAKENKELISQKLHDAEERLQELTLGCIETQEHLMSLQFKLAKQEQQMDIFRKAISLFCLRLPALPKCFEWLTINKFYKIREHAGRGIQEEKRGWDNDSGNIGLDDKCACLYNDPLEAWSFNGHQEAFTADYIAALQEQLVTLRCYIDDHQDKLQMILSNKLMTEGVSLLREYHAQQRIQIMDLLDDGKSYLQAVVVSIEEKLGNLSAGSGSAVVTEVTSSAPNVQPDDSSKTMGQALQEKHVPIDLNSYQVSALLLLSQQEERHLLEVRTALRGTLDELQRNLKQAMEEKVDALMELAEVKQEYQLLLERTIQERQDSLTGSSEGRKLAAGRDGKLKNLLKRKTSLKRWFSAKENISPVVDPQAGQEGSLTSSRSNLGLDDARLQIENATLKDNIQSLKCLTSNVHKLRLSLMQAKKTPVSEGTNDGTLRLLDEIIWEAELVKNALGSPFWPGEGDTDSSDDVIAEKDHEDSKSDSVFAAGLEMIELLLLATQITKGKIGE